MVFLLIPISLYAIYCLLLFTFQHKIMFPTGMAGSASNVEVVVPRPTVVELKTDQGTSRGWYFPCPVASEERPAPVVVFFHGNAELIDHQAPLVRMYHEMGVSVLLPEYRGYGHSEGSPSQKHIVGDARAMIEQVIARPEVDPDRLVLHGRSIGGGMAVQVAISYPPSAMIVESTFVDVSSFAWRFGVPPFLVRSPLRSGLVLKDAAYPVLIFHGRQDQIVPVDQGKRLHAMTPNSELVLFDCDHNTLPPAGEFDTYVEAIETQLADAGVINRE